jgi:hypothetical protein
MRQRAECAQQSTPCATLSPHLAEQSQPAGGIRHVRCVSMSVHGSVRRGCGDAVGEGVSGQVREGVDGWVGGRSDGRCIALECALLDIKVGRAGEHK